LLDWRPFPGPGQWPDSVALHISLVSFIERHPAARYLPQDTRGCRAAFCLYIHR